jgi:putative nucleotidyltransferase with HDIG domain
VTNRSNPAQSAPDRKRWSEHHAGARVVRIGLALTPTIVATFAVIALMQLMPPTSTISARLTWIVAIALAGFVVASATARFTIRLLPLTALMRLSLVFPDQAPSRLRLAIRAASSRHLRNQVESARRQGLSSDATEAAGQVLLLTSALGEHDRRTRGHSERVQLFARMLGEELGIRGDDLERLQWGALLHDVGKLTIPPEILNKAGELGATERAIMLSHAVAGCEMVEPLHSFLGSFVHAADGHHEKWDGSGYPSGLRGEQIPLAARIVAVADAYEVMTATRPYKKPMSADNARAELTRCAGTHFDPDVVRAWLRLSIGDLNTAAGPIAVLAALPLVGEIITLLTRAASHVAAVPAAAATLAPAAATAGAMTVAMVAAPPPPPAPSAADLALNLTTTTTWALPETTLVAEHSTVSTGSLAATTAEATTTETAPAEGDVSDDTSNTETTTQPAATDEESPPDTLAAEEIMTGSQGPSLTVVGPIPPGADLSPSGPFADGSFLFQDPARTLSSDLDMDWTVIPAGTTVCVHLFLTSDGDVDRPWRIDYGTQVLALARTESQLATTDWLSADGVIYGDPAQRGLDAGDDAQIIRNGTRVRLKLGDDDVDSVRIFLDCSS